MRSGLLTLPQALLIGTVLVSIAIWTVIVLQTSQGGQTFSGPPRLKLPFRDTFEGPFIATSGAGGAWDHGTLRLTAKAYNVDAADDNQVGVRVSFFSVDLSGVRLGFFPDVTDLGDWHFNRWSGGVQLGISPADAVTPPPMENQAMGVHYESSAGVIVYSNPSPNQGSHAWWAPKAPGSRWNAEQPDATGYDVRKAHGSVVNYIGKGFYVFDGVPPTNPLEGDIAFPGEYDGYHSNYWYPKDSIVPHTEWLTGHPATEEERKRVNTFDLVMDVSPVAGGYGERFRRYKIEWWLRKHQSSATLEGNPGAWLPDSNDPDGGWVQSSARFWIVGGVAGEGTMTGADEPGFDFSSVSPYMSVFGWWRHDQPANSVQVGKVVIEYISKSAKNPRLRSVE